MLFRTHLAFSFLAAMVLMQHVTVPNDITFLLVFLFFSVMPDIDEYSSKISKGTKPFSTLIQLMVRHRGIFHSIYVPLLISVVLAVFHQTVLALAAITGYLSHLFMDALSVQGIRPLAPIINKPIKGFIRVNSILENILFLILVILVIYQLL